MNVREIEQTVKTVKISESKKRSIQIDLTCDAANKNL